MTETIESKPAVLEFRQAYYHAHLSGLGVSLRLDMRIEARQFVLIKLDRQRSIRLLADACCGLIRPREGTAWFLGHQWDATRPDHGNALRGQIGRSFGAGGWVSYLSVADNILIQQLHHTHRPVDELRDEAARLAQAFGLPGLPTVPPQTLSMADLERAALVRAFLGRPKLVVLEEPLRDATDALASLVNAALRAQDQGAAVLWLASQMPPPDDLLHLCTRRLRIRGSGQMEVLRA